MNENCIPARRRRDFLFVTRRSNIEFMNENDNPEAKTNSLGDVHPQIASNLSFLTVFIHELVIRLFDYSIFTARARMDPPREGDATIFFNFEWP